MTTTDRGRAAEAAVVEYLQVRGYLIMGRNWRTRWHEVDIIARRKGVIHFIEVKYRADSVFGSGFEMVGREKLQRLQRAALNWTQLHAYTGDYRIDVAGVTGDLGQPEIDYLENVITD